MGEHGVKFVEQDLPAWAWKPVAVGRIVVPGGSRRDRRHAATANRLARKHEARRFALAHAAVANAAEHERFAEYIAERRAKRAARIAAKVKR